MSLEVSYSVKSVKYNAIIYLGTPFIRNKKHSYFNCLIYISIKIAKNKILIDILKVAEIIIKNKFQHIKYILYTLKLHYFIQKKKWTCIRFFVISSKYNIHVS